MVENGITSRTWKMAEYIAGATYSDLPDEICRSAKRYILDSITNQIGGAGLSAGEEILEIFQEMGGKRESTILATGKKVPCLHACYVNSALSNILDFDDTYLYISHPGATIVPPALSLGEKIGSSGKEVINAVVLGYEVSLRICDAIRATPERLEQVWGMATWQIFGAVTVAAKLLNLNTDRVATALGLAGMSAPVPFLRKLWLEPADKGFSWIKNNYGVASMNGVLAAMLSARGYQGNQHIFDGDRGFWIMAGSDQCDFNRLTSGLGGEFLMTMTGIKPYANCRWIHTTLDALHEIMNNNEIDPERIKTVTVRSLKMLSLPETFAVCNPATALDSQFSVPVLVAMTLAGYPTNLGISQEHIEERLVQDLIARVKIEIDPDADRLFHEKRLLPSTVLIEMIDGTVYSQTCNVAKGEPEFPLTDDELKGKFIGVTAPLAGIKSAEYIYSQVEKLEGIDNVAEVTGRSRRRWLNIARI